jgi:class 3 adenylate cyclase
VFYGNLGSKECLDFMAIGRAVNEISRVLTMNHSVDQDVLLSARSISGERGLSWRRRRVAAR